MAEPKIKQLRQLQENDLRERLGTTQTEVSKERGHIASGTRPENPGQVRAKRKTISRILTLLHEKKSKEGKTKK